MPIHSDLETHANARFHFSSAGTRHLIAGGLAGAGARILTHPLDRARTTMQLFPNEPRFRSMSTTFETFVRELGWRIGLFRGLYLSLMKIVPEIALKFAVYEEVRKRLSHVHEHHHQGSFVDRLAAGGSAGFVSHLLTYPFRVVQTRLANQRPFGSEFKGIVDCFVKLHSQTGFLGFYRGFLVSVTAMAPATALDFAFYGFLKKLYKHHYHTQGQLPPSHVLLACASVAASIAHVVTFPLILPRIRMQASDKKALLIQTRHKTTLGYLWDAYREEGVRKGLYRGLTPSLLKIVPAVSLSFLFYEKILQQLAP